MRFELANWGGGGVWISSFITLDPGFYPEILVLIKDIGVLIMKTLISVVYCVVIFQHDMLKEYGLTRFNLKMEESEDFVDLDCCLGNQSVTVIMTAAQDNDPWWIERGMIHPVWWTIHLCIDINAIFLNCLGSTMALFSNGALDYTDRNIFVVKIWSVNESLFIHIL